MIDKEFVPYGESLEMKELGFDEPCFAIYVDKQLQINATYQNHLEFKGWVASPTFSQAFRWFRDKYNKLSPIDHATGGWYFVIREIGGSTDPILKAVCGSGFKSYEEAELACLRKLIEIVKEKQSSIPDENFDYVKPNAKTLPMLKKIYGDCATDKTATFQVPKKRKENQSE